MHHPAQHRTDRAPGMPQVPKFAQVIAAVTSSAAPRLTLLIASTTSCTGVWQWEPGVADSSRDPPPGEVLAHIRLSGGTVQFAHEDARPRVRVQTTGHTTPCAASNAGAPVAPSRIAARQIEVISPACRDTCTCDCASLLKDTCTCDWPRAVLQQIMSCGSCLLRNGALADWKRIMYSRYSSVAGYGSSERCCSQCHQESMQCHGNGMAEQEQDRGAAPARGVASVRAARNMVAAVPVLRWRQAQRHARVPRPNHTSYTQHLQDRRMTALP